MAGLRATGRTQRSSRIADDCARPLGRAFSRRRRSVLHAWMRSSRVKAKRRPLSDDERPSPLGCPRRALGTRRGRLSACRARVRSWVASARGGMRSPRPNRPRNRLFGDFLASSRARFGSIEPNICLRAAVYGTEGQRFESSRARYSTRKMLRICRGFVSGASGATWPLGRS